MKISLGPRTIESRRRPLSTGCDHLKYGLDAAVLLDRMAQRLTGMNLITIAPAHFCAAQISRLDEIGNNPLGRSFRDPDFLRHITQPYLLVLCNREQNMTMVC